VRNLPPNLMYNQPYPDSPETPSFMNRTFTILAEKALDFTYTTYRGPRTGSPFRLPDPSAWWLSASPEEFFAAPADVPDLQAETFRLGPLGTRARFRFASSYTSPHPANNIVHGVADLRPAGQARAALVFVHGHKMSTFLPLELFARRIIRGDFDVYYLALPYHMARAPRGTWSGQHSLNADVETTALAFMQGVRDLRALLNWIEQERGLPVALAGVSLGAFTACMAAVVDPRPRAVVSIIGGGSLARIVWDGYQLGQVRRQLEAGGVGLPDLERYWSLLSPENWQPRLGPEQVLLLGGQFDPIVTPANTLRLWQAWGQPEIHWYRCGHVTAALNFHDFGQAMRRFLRQQVLGI
jgi:hypothetical protein